MICAILAGLAVLAYINAYEIARWIELKKGQRK